MHSDGHGVNRAIVETECITSNFTPSPTPRPRAPASFHIAPRALAILVVGGNLTCNYRPNPPYAGPEK